MIELTPLALIVIIVIALVIGVNIGVIVGGMLAARADDWRKRLE